MCAAVEKDIYELFQLILERGASDLHIRVPSPPVFRIDGRLVPQLDLDPVTPEYASGVLNSIASAEQKELFQKEKEIDFAVPVTGIARFRVSAMLQRGSVSLAFRLVPFKVPTIEELGLPDVCRSLVLKPKGLILITGPTGAGKSTTIAAMIDYLNRSDRRNIITIEDPIEYLYKNELCLIAQRDFGDDTNSFDAAPTRALRHDPDVIVVGEMRDLPTMEAAIRAAETGHLVLATLHTIDAPQTIDRVIDMFPAAQQQQIKLQLSQVLEAILSQRMLARASGKGRIAAFEILIVTAAARNLIREAKTYELASIMQLGANESMCTLEQSLAQLVKQRIVTKEEAVRWANNPRQLERFIEFKG